MLCKDIEIYFDSLIGLLSEEKSSTLTKLFYLVVRIISSKV